MKKVHFFLSLLLAFSLPFFVSAGIPGAPELKPAINAEIPPPCALPAPAAVNVSNITSYSATASWTPVPGATWYKVRLENLNSPTVPNAIQYVPAPLTSANLTGLTENTQYVAHVSATSCGQKDTYGAEKDGPFATPAIVIEDIVYLEPCRNSLIPIDITYPPNPNEISLLANSSGGQPTNYDVYVITKGNASYSFGVWLAPENGVSKPRFNQITALGIERTPPIMNPPANITTSAIGLRISNTTSDFCTIRSIASSSLDNPKLTLSFVNDGAEVPHLFKCHKGFKSDGDSRTDQSTTLVTSTPKLTATPNPLTDQTTLHYTTGKDSPVTLSLYNSTGTLVKTVLNKVWTEAGNQETTVEMSDLPNGLYFVTLETNEGRQVSTLVKTN